jgi:ectoine hydroxylase-related dioxygenase (phytanoyl-CoA dioxygenase family)
VLVFDGANLKHGNYVNRTGSTRVSFDFRVIPRSRYVDSDRTSVNTGVPFKVGGYFTV